MYRQVRYRKPGFTSSILGSRLKIHVLNPASTYSRLTQGLYLFLPCYYVYWCGVTAVVTIGIVGVRVPLDCMELAVSTLFFSSVRLCMAVFESYEALNPVELKIKGQRDSLATCCLKINFQRISITAPVIVLTALSGEGTTSFILTRF